MAGDEISSTLEGSRRWAGPIVLDSHLDSEQARVKHRGEYPPEWPEIARGVKEAAYWRCIRCHHEHDSETGHVLTVHHWDGDKANCRWWNLLALCQRCHLSIQARVNPRQPWLFEHSDWCKPYAAGFYAWKYLGQDITREQAEGRQAELLSLESG